MSRYEDGSSCDDEDNDCRGDAEGESRLQEEWYIEQMCRQHLQSMPNYPWTAEELLEDLCNDMDNKGIPLDEDERLEVIRELLTRKEGD